MNVSAADKGTGKSESITITNDKGCLVQDQIDCMVAEAEESRLRMKPRRSASKLSTPSSYV